MQGLGRQYKQMEFHLFGKAHGETWAVEKHGLFYSAIKKNEIRPSLAPWMAVEIITLSKVKVKVFAASVMSESL